MGDLSIRTVETKADREAFIRLPDAIHAGDPNWIPQLRMERREHLSPKNPFFDHAQAQFWLAVRDGAPVGRISAQIDSLHVERHGEQAHFGFLDGVNDPAVFAALLGVAEHWAAERGMRSVLGPASLSANDEFGMLIEGFDSPPRMLMNYSQPWYAQHVEAAGYETAKTLHAYRYELSEPLTKAATWMAQKAAANPRIVFRKFDRKRLKQDIHLMVDIFNDAWAENWGFVPMTKGEIDHMAAQIAPILNTDIAWFAELDGKPVAMIVAIPDVNEALHGLGGRLTPLNVLKLVWRLKVSGLKRTRVLMMGVRQELRDNFLSGALTYALIERVAREGRRVGVQEAELSWVLEDNLRMSKIIESVAGAPYKRYRLYRKDLP